MVVLTFQLNSLYSLSPNPFYMPVFFYAWRRNNGRNLGAYFRF